MAYIADGPVGALRSLVQTYAQIPAAEQWVDFVARYTETVLNQQPLHLNAPPAAIATIQSTIGYTFSNAQVLIDALSQGTRACERLEFVGDAALDLVAAVHWVTEYPTTPVSKLAEIKSASVCNNFLAMVFIELGLHQWIQRGSQFHRSIAKVLPSHTAMLAATPTGDFWMEVDYAKGIADVMEAVLGAVYIDSEFDIRAVTAVFDNCVLPFIREYLPIDCVVFCQDKLAKICPHLSYTFAASSAQSGSSSTECTIALGGVVLERATSARNFLARRVACRRVIERLNQDPNAFAAVCGCFQKEVGSQ